MSGSNNGNRMITRDETAATGVARRRMRIVAWYLLSLLVPCVVILATFYSLRLYPFGDDTISVWDLQITYTYFYQWFQNVLTGDGNIFYSFGKSLGGNMFATVALFETSPISWLSVLFAGDNIMEFVTFSIVVKFALAGVTSFHYLRKRFDLPEHLNLCLSICYSMMLFMTTQSANPMWMDAVVIFPLVLLGIYRLVDRGKPVLFFISILVCIIIDWYNGYMICLFSILFYLLEGYLAAPDVRARGGRVHLGCLVAPARFVIVLALAVLASFIVLYPTALGLLGGKGSIPGGLFDISFRYDFVDVFRSFFLGIYEKEYLPQFYTGTFVLIGAIWFLMDRKIEKRERIAVFALLAFMVFSTWFAPFDRIWCGFRDGNSFYCRYTFLASGVLLFMAARALSTLSKGTVRALILSSSIVFVIAGIIFCSKDYPGMRYLLATWTMCVAIPVLLAAPLYVGKRKAVIPLVCLLVVAVTCEVTLSCRQVFQYRLQSSTQTTFSRYDSYFGDGLRQHEELVEADGDPVDAYRVGKLYSFVSTPVTMVTSNEGLVYGYSQVAGYDSAYDDRVQNFAAAIGYSGNWNCLTTYNYPVLPADSLLGIRYVSASGCPVGFQDVGLDVAQDGNRFFENPYALPLGFGASWDIAGDSIGMDVDPFEYQNALYSRLLGEDVALYRRVPAKLVVSDEGERTWEVQADPGDIIYGYITGDPWLSLDLYVDGVYHYSYLDQWSQGIFPVAKGDDAGGGHTVSLKVKENPSPWLVAAKALPDDEEFGPSFYVLDESAFEKAVDELRSHPFEIDTFEDGHVSGTYEADADGLLFTSIPFDEGWTIEVNGEKVSPQMVQDTFIGIPVSAGKNRIEMHYLSPGVIPGACASLVAVVLFILYCLFITRRDSGSATGEVMVGLSDSSDSKKEKE